jgi:hypothetical protein
MSGSRLASLIVFLSTGFALLDSLHRHGSHSLSYGVIFVIATLVMFGLWVKGK